MRVCRAVSGLAAALALATGVFAQEATQPVQAVVPAASDAAGLVMLKEAFSWDVSVAARSFQEGKVIVDATVRPDLLEAAPAREVSAKYGIDLPTTADELRKAFSADGRDTHVICLSGPDAVVRKFRVIVNVKPGGWGSAVRTPWIEVSLEPKGRVVSSAEPAGYVLSVIPFAGAVLEPRLYDALAAAPAVRKLLEDWKTHVKVRACGRILGAKRYGAHELEFDAPIITKAGWIRRDIIPDFPYTRHILVGILYVLALGTFFALAVLALKKMARD